LSSQKIGPYSLAILARCWDGALESTDSMLPTTGLVGGCGIGLSLLTDAIVKVSPGHIRRMGRAQRNPSKTSCVCDGFRCAQPILQEPLYPNRFLRHSMIFALTSSGFSCCVQWPLSRTRYFSRSGMIFSMPSAADGGRTASFSAMIISDGTRTV